MHTTKSIFIAAARADVFAVAADLPRWPDYLPHYRYNRYLSRLPEGGIIKMSAVRSGLPLTWTSIYRYNEQSYQMHFEHLKPTTRGMVVRWEMEPRPGGVEVTITHDFTLKWPVIGPFVAERIIGNLLVDHVAGLTLAGLKRRLETRS